MSQSATTHKSSPDRPAIRLTLEDAFGTDFAPFSPVSEITAAGPTHEDRRLQQQAIHDLVELGQTFPLRIHVQAGDSNIFIRGTVSSQAERLAILERAARLNGVDEVHDLLVVKGRFQANEIAERRPSWSGLISRIFGISAAVLLGLISIGHSF